MDLNTHRKHKNSTIVPQQCRATSQNFSEGERREKHLITSNPCEPFWSPKVLGCPRPCVCSVSGNDLPLHERCSVLQRGCLPWSSAAPFLVNSSFPGLPLAGALWPGWRGKAQGCQGPQPGLLQGLQDPPSEEQLLAPAGRPAAQSLWRICSQTDCYETHNTLSQGTAVGPVDQDWPISLSGSPLETA